MESSIPQIDFLIRLFDKVNTLRLNSLSMRKIVLFLFIVLQAIFFAGAVCGNNLSASKSMACCQNEEMNHLTVHDAKGDSCCSHCDMGKNQSMLKLQKAARKESSQLPQTMEPANQVIFHSAFRIQSTHNQSECGQAFNSSSPPRFLLDQQFRI